VTHERAVAEGAICFVTIETEGNNQTACRGRLSNAGNYRDHDTRVATSRSTAELRTPNRIGLWRMSHSLSAIDPAWPAF